MLDTTLLDDCEGNVFDLLKQWNFDITSGGEHVTTQTPTGKTFNSSRKVFLSLWTYHFSPDKPNTNFFVNCDFGCVFAMTRLIMRMICIMCENDSLLTTHLTPLVIGAPLAKSYRGKIRNK
jgi:hypothetical protein